MKKKITMEKKRFNKKIGINFFLKKKKTKEKKTTKCIQGKDQNHYAEKA